MLLISEDISDKTCMKNYQRDQEIKPFYCNSEVQEGDRRMNNISFIHDERK